MPPFHLPDETGRLLGLDGFLERGPVVVVFHRGHWCPYCRMSARALAAAQPRIAAAGGQLVAILPERAAYAARLKAQAGADYPFLSDMDNGYAMSLGLVFWMGRELARLYRANANAVSRYQGNDGWMVPLPAIFVVGRDGRVAARFVDPDYRRRMAIDDLVATVAAAR
jgi:peroxiredoxin